MVRWSETDGLPYDVDLCFTVHKLLAGSNEDRHVYYDEKNHQINQKLVENLCFTFVRIIHDV